jgi:branched-chain amino acid transport system ATP-binding protein
MSAILEVAGISKRFGGLQALREVSFTVPAEGIYGIMGANGAGKTTLFNIIAGSLRPDTGEIRLRGENVTGLIPSRLCASGVARTFQITRPFPELTVRETVQIGLMNRVRSLARARARADAVIERFALGPRADTHGRHLTVVERKRLELARAYATGPAVLLLDEVGAGLRPAEVQSLVGLVRDIAAEGITVLMIEHVLPAIFALAAHIVVLDHGRKIAEGTPDEITKNSAVIKAYLGADYGAPGS